ncbi:uncharacterized protein LOC136078892 [Hydra vulgaris]|uniref:Uncharacterized protein LOC136078892 n=1 Tax=Hydra vulgaris TaxID=6087 RepID=A0ABM4BNV4_HYDVU
MSNIRFYCTTGTCNKKAEFGPGKEPIRCKNHIEINDERIQINSNKILYIPKCVSCAQDATHGNIITRTVVHCKQHASANEVDVSLYRCTEENCSYPANYDFENHLSYISDFRRCFMHKIKDQINIRIINICSYPDCKVYNPCYGYMEPQKLQIRCAAHKMIGQIIVIKNIKCEFDDVCPNIPTHGYLTSLNERTHCEKHKLPDQYDLKITKKCKYKYCLSPAIYGKPSLNALKHCEIHKIYGESLMYLCSVINCKSIAYFAPIGKTGVHCLTHRKIFEFDTRIYQKCFDKNCQNLATYGPPFKRPGIHCVEHKSKDDVDVSGDKCLVNQCTNIAGYTSAG